MMTAESEEQAGVRYGRLWLVMLYWLASSVYGAQVTLSAGQGLYDLGGHLAWLRDPTHALSVDAVAAQPESVWTPSNAPIPNLGYSSDSVWFRLAIANQDAAERWYLAINYPLIRRLEVYVFQSGERSAMFQTGDRFEFAARPVLHRDFVFPLVIPASSDVTIYIRVSGPYSIQMPLRLLDERAMVEQDSLMALAHGLFFGFVLVMSVYNLFLFLGTGERSYLFYVLFSVSIGMFQFVEQGFAYQLLWPQEVGLQNRATGLFILLSLLSSFFFVTHFLGVRSGASGLYRAFGAIAVIAFLLLLTTPWLDEGIVLRAGVVLSVPACLLAMVGGWFSWRSGRPDARLFTIAWAVFLIGVLLLALNKLGVVPRNFFTEHGAEVGTVVELGLLALALARRINLERAQRIALEQQARELERSALLANERALELERLSNDHLEWRVRERTEELERALSKLSDANRQLEHLNTRDPVTGVGNENRFVDALQCECERSFRNGEVLSLLVVELDRYRDILADFGQVAAEECLKSVADILVRNINRPADLIARYGDKVFGVLLPGTHADGARFIAQRVADQIHQQPFNFGICQISATVSIGVATVLPSHPDQGRALLLSAESAVYVAQNNGGDQIQQALVAEPLMTSS